MAKSMSGPTRKRKHSALKKIAWTAGGLSVGIPAAITAYQYRDVALEPLAGLWGQVPAPIRTLAEGVGIWGLVVLAGLAVVYLAYRVWRLVSWTPGASVTVVAGGGYAEALRGKIVAAMPRWIRRKVHGAYVLPDDRVRGQEAKRKRTLDPNAIHFAVKPGEEESATKLTHQVAARTYARPISKATLEAERTHQVVSLGGMTGTHVTTALAGKLTKRPVLGTVVGDTPKPVLDAVNDPDLYAKARAFQQEHAPGSIDHGDEDRPSGGEEAAEQASDAPGTPGGLAPGQASPAPDETSEEDHEVIP